MGLPSTCGTRRATNASVDGVEVLSVVHEGLTEGRGAVETGDAVVGEGVHRVEPGDAQEVQFGVRAADLIDRVAGSRGCRWS